MPLNHFNLEEHGLISKVNAFCLTLNLKKRKKRKERLASAPPSATI